VDVAPPGDHLGLEGGGAGADLLHRNLSSAGDGAAMKTAANSPAANFMADPVLSKGAPHHGTRSPPASSSGTDVSLPDAPRRDFAILFAVLMSVAAGNTALTAVLPAIGRELGLADTMVAGVFSLSALLWAVTAPFWARVSDRRGRKPMIQLGLLGYGVSMTSFGLVVLAGLNGWIGALAVFAGLMLTRSVFGLTGSASAPAAQAYVADRRRLRNGPLRWRCWPPHLVSGRCWGLPWRPSWRWSRWG
jgi:hypothetical protein